MELFFIFPSTCLFVDVLHTHIPRVTHMFLWGGHEWKGLEALLCTEVSPVPASNCNWKPLEYFISSVLLCMHLKNFFSALQNATFVPTKYILNF